METFFDILRTIWDFILHYKTSVFLIIFAISIEIIARRVKAKNKKLILDEYGESIDQENNEFYLKYYQKNQIIDFIRVITSIFLIMALFVIHTDINLGFFAVATGAIIIAFKDFILSILAFFFVTPSYPIGLTVKVAGVQGQIIFIRMLSVGILGKDNRGENSGELFLVPSHKFLTEIVHKQELRSTSIFKDYLEIPYSPEHFSVDFSTFMAELRTFLQDLFPLKNANNVGNFTSYTGHKYKMSFSYDEEIIQIQVRFVGKNLQNQKYKEQIIAFVDTFYKREEKEKVQ